MTIFFEIDSFQRAVDLQLEGIVSTCLSAALTAGLYKTTNENFNGDAIDWVLLSFAVITPISAIINMAFNRRERALVEIASFRASCIALYQSHAMWGWNWKENISGRPETMKLDKKAVDSKEHSDEVMRSLLVSQVKMVCLFVLSCQVHIRCSRSDVDFAHAP